MVKFNDWCGGADTPVGNHRLHIRTDRAADRPAGVQLSAAAVPDHYAAEESIARVSRRLGKPGAADLVTGLLPQAK